MQQTARAARRYFRGVVTAFAGEAPGSAIKRLTFSPAKALGKRARGDAFRAGGDAGASPRVFPTARRAPAEGAARVGERTRFASEASAAANASPGGATNERPLRVDDDDAAAEAPVAPTPEAPPGATAGGAARRTTEPGVAPARRVSPGTAQAAAAASPRAVPRDRHLERSDSDDDSDDDDDEPAPVRRRLNDASDLSGNPTVGASHLPAPGAYAVPVLAELVPSTNGEARSRDVESFSTFSAPRRDGKTLSRRAPLALARVGSGPRAFRRVAPRVARRHAWHPLAPPRPRDRKPAEFIDPPADPVSAAPISKPEEKDASTDANANANANAAAAPGGFSSTLGGGGDAANPPGAGSGGGGGATSGGSRRARRRGGERRCRRGRFHLRRRAERVQRTRAAGDEDGTGGGAFEGGRRGRNGERRRGGGESGRGRLRRGVEESAGAGVHFQRDGRRRRQEFRVERGGPGAVYVRRG